MATSSMAAVLLQLITVHGPTNQEINVNIADISSIRRTEAYDDPRAHFAKGVKCILVMNNGKIISTMETCPEVIKKIAEVNK
jgi:hypothetical protein